ncbi:MAG: septum formation protein Maf [Flavobacteriales bacterium]|nr:septum formation protein Maf [Flavobacteriales bacterium]MCC6939861.1 septum formation protein Maf [Flavobacteriales bacterium]
MNAPPIHPWRLILASASPRRRQLLQGLDLPVEITRVDVDETPPAGMPHDRVAEHLAVCKAEAWTGTLAKDQVLITADTTVLVDDTLLNKPEDDADARRMLALLSGRSHRVITGVCLRTATGTTNFADTAVVHFRALDAAEIAYYVAQHKPLDKAGAYGVQDWIGYTAVDRIEGSFYTVMGLPMHRVYTALRMIPTPH